MKPSAVARRRAARLMAVQAVYQAAINHKEPVFIIDEYLFLRKGMDIEGETMIEPDGTLFKNIVMGVSRRGEDLSAIVEANRPVKEGGRPREPLLESVLLCGTYELLAHHEIDTPIIISSYVDVAKAFFGGNEPSLINAILDSTAKVVRS